jgi:hypothetical protein
MSYGLRVWDENGGIILDVMDRLVRFHSQVTVNFTVTSSWQVVIQAVTVNVSVPGISNDGTWFVVPALRSGLTGSLIQITPGIMSVTEYFYGNGGYTKAVSYNIMRG